jgi:hypothetical protein
MLSHLFICFFNDGSFIQQTEEDISTIDPVRSAFYDVAQRPNDVVLFCVVGNGHNYTVDLRDGHFEIDGVRFDARPDMPDDDCEYRLIYFRRHKQIVIQGKDGEHSIKYHIGWQTTINGKNYQQIISF